MSDTPPRSTRGDVALRFRPSNKYTLPPGWSEHLLTAGDTVGSRVARLCELCVSSLDVSGASLQLIADGPHRMTVHATDRMTDQLDDPQLALGEGPCVDVARTAGPALEDDLKDSGAIRRQQVPCRGSPGHRHAHRPAPARRPRRLRPRVGLRYDGTDPTARYC